MAVPRIFATQPAGNVPASYLDEDFAAHSSDSNGTPSVIIQGDTTSSATWSNAVISGTSADAVLVRDHASVFVQA